MMLTARKKKPAHHATTTAIYARYSSHNQDDGTSIEVQLDACRRAAGCETVQYVDRAVTGTTMERESFSRLLNDCETGRIKTVYVYKWDRFGRSARAHAVIADLEDWGVKVISATEGEEPLSRGILVYLDSSFDAPINPPKVIGAHSDRAITVPTPAYLSTPKPVVNAPMSIKASGPLEDILVVEQVANLLGCSVRTVWRCIDDGRLAQPARGGRSHTWLRSEVLECRERLKLGKRRSAADRPRSINGCFTTAGNRK